MKKLGFGTTLVAALALCFALVGCGGASPDYTANFAGNWELNSIDASENGSTAEEITMLKGLGLTCTLNLAEDGTATLDLFGDTNSGTWEATSEDEAVVTIAGDAIAAHLSGDKLSLEQAEDKLIFAKAGTTSAEVSDVSSGAAGDTADEAADEVPEADVAEDEAAEDEAA